MNWNNIQKIKFKIYDEELNQFFADDELAELIHGSEEKQKRYFPVFNESELTFGYHLANGDWRECNIFQYSGYRDKNGKELYLYDVIKHADASWAGVIDIEQGRWVVRYDSQRTAPLADRHEYIEFAGHPTID